MKKGCNITWDCNRRTKKKLTSSSSWWGRDRWDLMRREKMCWELAVSEWCGMTDSRFFLPFPGQRGKRDSFFPHHLSNWVDMSRLSLFHSWWLYSEWNGGKEKICVSLNVCQWKLCWGREMGVFSISLARFFLSAFLSVKQEERDQGRGKMRQKYVIFKRYGGKEGKNAVRDRFSESQEGKGEMTRWGWVVVGVLLLRQFLASCFSLWLTKAFRWRGEMRCKDDLVVSRFVYIILVGRWDERREMTWDMRMRDAMYAKWDDVGSELFWIEGEREWKSGSENGRQKRQVPSHLSSLNPDEDEKEKCERRGREWGNSGRRRSFLYWERRERPLRRLFHLLSLFSSIHLGRESWSSIQHCAVFLVSLAEWKKSLFSLCVM